MIRKLMPFFLVALTLLGFFWANRFNDPVEERPRLEEHPRIRAEMPPRQPAREYLRDGLTKSTKRSVEENVNALSIEEDIEFTRDAENNGITRKPTMLSQDEAMQVHHNVRDRRKNITLEEFRTTLPPEILKNLQYEYYLLSYDYFLVTSPNVTPILKDPKRGAAQVDSALYGEKITLHEKIQGETVGDSNIWYRVSCKDNDQVNTGYIHSQAGVPRKFRFDEMLKALQDLNQQVLDGKLHYISNYKNVNGAPPVKNNGITDEFGYRIYQSAPGYLKPDTASDFRYLPDGILLKILSEDDVFYRVFVPTFNSEFFVPKQYIKPNVYVDNFNHVIVVDRREQNQATFEINPNGTVMISYTLSTTGLRGHLSFETPLGYYKAIEKKERFEYLGDNSAEIAGYAPYAIRFSGGAYIHGVPVDYEVQEGERIDPGKIEYLHTIGTFPRSHMCVRNFTSHAKFLYDWMKPEAGAIIIIG
jgi:lipoprotein-anchoring transpeptidase ErfK/SrfK